MKEALQHTIIKDFVTHNGAQQDIHLSYQLFGQPLGAAPVVLVNHALTGNSNVAGETGWWNSLIGEGKCIDTDDYTILAFNIPGNGFDGVAIENYKDFIARDVAKMFLSGLEVLGVNRLFALIGGSLGGGIAWEMAVLAPNITEHLIPVASDWKATDWLIANCQIQELFLENSKNPVHDARMHAMLCYRTPESFKKKFNRTTNDEQELYNVESWLLHHGKRLQERFQLSAYKLMNQLLRTIDATKGADGAYVDVLSKINANIHIVAVDSDLFFTAEENRETQKLLAQLNDNVTYGEINSLHGHDAFLIEFSQLEKLLEGVFNPDAGRDRYKVLKFGGKSLATDEGVKQVVRIVAEKVLAKEKIALVVSARGKSTDLLEEILESAAKGVNYQEGFEVFKAMQTGSFELDFSEEFQQLQTLFDGVGLVKDYSSKTKDEVLSQGEVIAAKLLTALLQQQGINAALTDTRELIKTDESFGNAQPLEHLSKENVVKHFATQDGNVVHVVTGFIASNANNETTTLGRNGSNYTASLIANFLDAEELQTYTNVDGIYTADPDLVPDAKKIERLSYNEANELAYFGTTVLHAKTIIPLIEKNIPLRILNTFNHQDSGTLITSRSSAQEISSLSTLEDVALIKLFGRGLLGKVGVDARIFKALAAYDISVSIIAQGSSERGIGFVVDQVNAKKAVLALQREFELDFHANDVNNIAVVDDVAVISIIGQDLKLFHKTYGTLIENEITPILFNNTVTGKNVNLVVEGRHLHRAMNVIHAGLV